MTTKYAMSWIGRLGNWRFFPRANVIIHRDATDYEMDCDDLKKKEDCLEWANHIAKKRWVTPNDIWNLFDVFTSIGDFEFTEEEINEAVNQWYGIWLSSRGFQSAY